MDMKKITAFAMLVLMVIPSLTMTVGADNGDGAGLAGAIERAQTYLGKVRDLADNMNEEYNDEIQGYLDEIYELLGRYEGEEPEILYEMGKKGSATAELSDVETHSGTSSVHLKTTGEMNSNPPSGPGDEARIVILMPEGFTLGDLKTLSWWEYLVTGYPPHVDVYLELGENDDSLCFEYANNGHIGEAPMPYGALTGEWYKTFNDDNLGPAQIHDSAYAWPNAGPPGPGTGEDFELHTLADWKEGITYTVYGVTRTINSSCIVTKLEIEVDNWVVQTEAYVDDIKINKDIYDFEEENGDLGAEAFLEQASECYDAGDFKSAARNLSAARNILGRINGLLRSMAKAHKVTRTEKFNRRIQGIRDKIERPKGPNKK